MTNNLNVTTVGDMIYGFIDNMPDEQIDQEMKLFRRYARMIGCKNYNNMVVLIDDSQDYDPYYINPNYSRSIIDVKSGDGWQLINAFKDYGQDYELMMVREQREGSWNIFYFFKDEADLDKYVDLYDHLRYKE